jgi:aryl-alcohol dehydrogenase-like predicted oxidoreductase
MHMAVEASLRRLKTDYIDLFYLHLWDGTTEVDEVMRGFEDLIRAGKVLYPGVSNIPAWIAARAQTLAELRGLSPLVSLQILYSLAARAAERDLAPMAASLGIAVTAWSPLAGGVLTGKYRGGVDTKTSRGYPIADQTLRLAEEVQKIAAEAGASPAQIALAWLLGRNAIPVIGARTVSQLADNLGAFDVSIGPETAARLDEVSRMPLGYPQDLLASPFMDRQLFAGERDKLTPPNSIIS